MASQKNILSGDIITRIDQLITDQCFKAPDSISLKYEGESYSYQQLNDISNRLALYFKQQHIGNGSVVALILDRSPVLIFVLLALVKAGAAYLPLDSNLPLSRVNYMLEDSKADFLIMSNADSIQLPLDTIQISVEEAMAKSAGLDQNDYTFEAVEDSVAYVLYTSGSTGKPKGVQVKHSGLLNLLVSLQQAPGCTNTDIVLATSTISFDVAAIEIFLPLISGATIVLADTETVKDGRLLIAKAKREAVTIMQGTPALWLNMLNSGWEAPLNIKAFSGGEAMPKDFIENVLPKCSELWNMYGPTETTIYSTVKKITAHDKIITVGKPIADTEIYMVDEDGNEVATGEIGEMYIGGAGVAQGYINKPELTAEKFLDDPFSPPGKIYRSGDLGRYLENGEIECLGRADYQIKIRGFRIEPGEVEYYIKGLKNVNDSLVVSFKDALGNDHLGAYVVLSKDVDEKINNYLAEWKTGLRENLPEYMVPDTFKKIPAIPRLPNGKINRHGLPPIIIGEAVSDKFEEPVSEAEVSLTKIFLSFIAVNKIGVNDNFFESGLDSLTAVRIMVQIEQEFCKRLPLSTLIQYPTIKTLAAYLADGTTVQFKCLVPIKSSGNKMPLYIVHGIGLNVMNLYGMVSHMDADQPVFGLQPLGLHGGYKPLDNMEAIARLYIEEIIEHNPAGPYAITGYSFGGYIVFEMARQLKAMGKELAMVGMFDSNIQNRNNAGKILVKTGNWLAKQLNKVLFRASTLINHPILATEYLGVHFRNELGLFMVNAGLKEVYNPDKLPPFMIEIIEKLLFALDNYTFRPLDIEIELFKADVRMYFVDDPNQLGWGQYALKGVNVYNVPGDHKHMFSFPHDKVLAGVLQKKLNLLNPEN